MSKTITTHLDGIFDESGMPLEHCDPSLGRLEARQKIIRHEAVAGVAEEGHYETVTEYPNGGKDVIWVVDVPGVEAREAYDEVVIFSAFIPYTQDILDAMEDDRNKPPLDAEVSKLTAAMAAMADGIARA